MKERIRNLIENLTYEKRENKKVEKYKETIQRYTNMTEDELEMKYIEILSAYEYRRNVIFALLGAVLLATIMDIGKYFFEVISNLVTIVYESTGDAATVAQASLVASSAVFISALAIVICIILTLLQGMRKAISEKITIEKFMEKKTRKEKDTTL